MTSSTALGLVDGMARHLERGGNRFGRFTVQRGALEDTFCAVGDGLIGKKATHSDFEDGLAPGLVVVLNNALRRGHRASSGHVAYLCLATTLAERTPRLVAEDASQVVAEVPLLVRIVDVARQNAA